MKIMIGLSQTVKWTKLISIGKQPDSGHIVNNSLVWVAKMDKNMLFGMDINQKEL